MNWSQTNHEIKTKVGEDYKLSYFYIGDKKIIDISAGCGCTKTEFENNILSVVYKATPASIQLNVYPYKTTKRILITYEDYSTEDLTFVADVYQ